MTAGEARRALRHATDCSLQEACRLIPLPTEPSFEMLAAMAMQSVLAWTDVDLTPERVAERAYDFAEAMLAERAKRAL